MPGVSQLPAVMAYLYNLWQQVPLNDPSDVRYGPQPTNADAEEVISVGYLGPDDDAASQATASREGLAGTVRETFSVECAVAVLQGQDMPQPALERAFAIMAACQALVEKDTQLGGLCMSAYVGSWALRQDLTTGGMEQRLRFAVNVDAWQR